MLGIPPTVLFFSSGSSVAVPTLRLTFEMGDVRAINCVAFAAFTHPQTYGNGGF
jgi:hypothetical protein